MRLMMKVSDFDYNLPEGMIAVHPPKVRGASNLLVLNRENGEILDRKYSDLADFLRPGDVVVLNDTRVMRSRLRVLKSSGAERELVVLEKHSGDNDWHRHKVLYRGSLKLGEELTLAGSTPAKLVVDELLDDGLAVVGSKDSLLELTEKYGSPPLPPYMNRGATPEDIERYQTVFAREQGSAAAPTASLNMTKELLLKLQQSGVTVKYLTLHVGLGTFLPIRVDDIEEHKMHAEYFTIPLDTVEAVSRAKQSGGRVVAIGTTVARTLEYASGDILSGNQTVSGEADIFIYPGYNFKLVDLLLTNFHAPRSTVLMLTAAFAGWDKLESAYEHAKTHDYKFLSYGDSMLVI